jgi:hypothetical protein
MAQVRGHLAMCRGKAMQKGAVPQPVGNQLQPVTTASTANLESSPTGWQLQPAVAVVPRRNQLDGLAGLVSRVDKLENRVENEVQHLLVQNNPSVGDWLSENKGILILIGGVFLVVLLMRESSPCPPCKSDASEGRIRSKSSNIGSTLATRAVSKVIDKGLDKILK